MTFLNLRPNGVNWSMEKFENFLSAKVDFKML
jgi:hypothetical protein